MEKIEPLGMTREKFLKLVNIEGLFEYGRITKVENGHAAPLSVIIEKNDVRDWRVTLTGEFGQLGFSYKADSEADAYEGALQILRKVKSDALYDMNVGKRKGL